MSISTPQTEVQLEAPPDELESPRAKLVFLTLSIAEPATLAELHETLDVPKLTLLSVLDALAGRELIERTDDGYAALV
ncbi:hypothetical protein GCM10028857_14640 [Salinarchaeum chitinilyticum]